MLFGKKKKNDQPVPVEKIQAMTRRGMPDKEIIKRLKKEGYSYDDIERAMLSAVGQGVSEPSASEAFAPPQQTAQSDSFSLDDIYQSPAQQELPIEEDVGVSPEILIEELVEGVIDEKWNKFNQKIKKYEDELSNIETTIKQFEQRISAAKQEGPSKEIEVHVSTLKTQLEDLETRVGGLEKAFKQFLPTLTKNIESLSQMIHELKIKHNATIGNEEELPAF